MCKQAGKPIYLPHHSLRATTATRLHQSECIEKQEIMQNTGHRSIEAVISYKQLSYEQLTQVSDILYNNNKAKKVGNNNLMQLLAVRTISRQS